MCHQQALRIARIAALILSVLCALLVLLAFIRFTSDRPIVHDAPDEHFKYGSTGGERSSGIPYSVWKVMPVVCAQHLPRAFDRQRPYASFGFIYEEGHDLPIGVSRRVVQGVERVFVNCAVCHVGTVRHRADQKPQIVLGMPANGVDLQRFENFLFDCAADEQFTPDRIVPEIARSVPEEDWINRLLLRLVGIHLMRDRLLGLRSRFRSFRDREPLAGPGRVDTFNPQKVMLNFPMALLPREEWVGNCDLPSIWNQEKRQGFWLHWDGNNDSVDERNRNAAFGTGAIPPTLDRASLKKVADWTLAAQPPPWPATFPFDVHLAAEGARIYHQYCSECHGRDGKDFTGRRVGQVTPIDEIGTDRFRLDSYTYDLSVNQNLIYAGYGEERFSHFRKTYGYANLPLDGLWLRAPYLHNGSVPTLYDLLEPCSERPQVFYRGYDVYDAERVGFISNVAVEGARRYFLFDTRLPGNGNCGHEGTVYGTNLTLREKAALIEYLKRF